MNRWEQFKDIARYAFGSLVNYQTLRYHQAVLVGGQVGVAMSPSYPSSQPMAAAEFASLPSGAEGCEGGGDRRRQMASEPEVDTDSRVCVGAAPAINTTD